MSKLYELTAEYNDLYTMIDELPEEALADDDASAAIIDTLEGIQGELEDKAVNIALLVKDLRSEAEAIKAEEDRLKKRRQIKENAVKRISEYLSYNLLATGLKKIDTPQAVIKFTHSRSTEINDIEKIVEFCETNGYEGALKYTTEANKTELKKLIDRGIEIPGASIVEKDNISIK